MAKHKAVGDNTLTGILTSVYPIDKVGDEGQLNLAGLNHPVTVLRDEAGIAYIHARNMEDLFFAQGGVTAQDRLFYMQMTRMYYEGRICDIRMRTIGISRMAKKRASILTP